MGKRGPKKKAKYKIKTYDEMSYKQKRFVDFFDGNATQAAKKAGYSHYASMGNENLNKPSIAKAIAEREKREKNNRIATRKERQIFWTRVLLGLESGHKEVVDGEVVEFPPKMSDRLKASELLGRSEADFIEKIGIGGIGKDGEIKEIPLLFVKPPEQLPGNDPLKEIENKPETKFEPIIVDHHAFGGKKG